MSRSDKGKRSSSGKRGNSLKQTYRKGYVRAERPRPREEIRGVFPWKPGS